MSCAVSLLPVSAALVDSYSMKGFRAPCVPNFLLTLCSQSVHLCAFIHHFFHLLPTFPFCPSLSPRVLSHASPLALPRFLKALSFASLDKEELLSPINQSTLQRCSSVRSMVSSATFGCNDDYVGLALPMNINDMFHIRDSAYFQQRISPPSEERKRFLFGDGDGKNN